MRNSELLTIKDEAAEFIGAVLAAAELTILDKAALAEHRAEAAELLECTGDTMRQLRAKGLN